jgi:DNA-binding SARP family transcriptional activator/TolB-like protein
MNRAASWPRQPPLVAAEHKGYDAGINSLSPTCQLAFPPLVTMRLHLLGTPSIDRDGEPLRGPVTQRHRLALLSLLSSAGARGMSRERLLGYLWPESPEERGRRLLSESVYVLRRTLGAELISSDADVLCLTAASMWVDVVEFEGALARGERERAVELYGGAFLDGFYLEGTVELERWMEGERSRLSGLYLQALLGLAREAAAQGERDAAVGWLRRAAVHEPTNSSIAKELMRALVATGDAAGAIQHARIHEQILANDLGLGVDPGVADLVAEIQRRMFDGEVEDGETRLPDPADPADPPAAAPPTQADPASVDARVPHPAGTGRSWSARMPSLLLILLVGVALAGRVTHGRAGEERSDAEGKVPEVAVLPFSVRGAPELEELGYGMVELLSAQMEELSGLRPLSPRVVLDKVEREGGLGGGPAAVAGLAERLSARYYIVGEVVAVSSRLRLTAALYQSGSARPISTASVDGSVDGIFSLVDRLGMELLTRADRSPAGRLTRAAAVTTESLPAFRAFLRADHLLRTRAREAGIEALEEAVREDSTFALAHYRLSLAAEAAIRPDRAERAADAAFRHRDRLPGRYRRLVEAAHAWRHGEVERAEQSYGELVATYPDEVEAWFGLAEVLYHANPLRGRSLTESRRAWERVLALDPRHVAALNHLVRIAAMQDEPRLVAQLAASIQQEDPASAQALEARVLSALVSGRDSAAPALPDDLGSARPASLLYLAWLSAGLMQDPVTAQRITLPLLESSRPPEVRGAALIVQAYLEVARGRWRAASARLDEAEPLHPVEARLARALLVTIPHAPVTVQELERARRDLYHWAAQTQPSVIAASPVESVHEGFHPLLRHYLLGRLEAELGHARAALAHAESLEKGELESAGGHLSRVLAAGIRGRVRGEGRDAPIYGARVPFPLSGISYQIANRSPLLAQTDERFHHARALELAGRQRAALAWYRTIAEGSRLDFVYLAPAHLRQVEIHEAMGDRARAAWHLARFVELWEQADPELEPMVNAASRRLEQLGRAGVQPMAPERWEGT